MKPVLQVVTVGFDLTELSNALRLPPTVVERAFKDGRGASPFTEHWGERVFEYATHTNSNQPFSDGLLALRHLGDLKVSVKALTASGVKFQQSKFQGSNRPPATKEDLVASLEACDRVVVVDIRCFPIVEFYPLDVGRLLSAAHTGALTKNGWAGKRFEGWIEKTYDVVRLTVPL